MRVIAIAAIVGFAVSVSLALPASAQDRGNYNAHCRKLTKQIAQYQDVEGMARERGNAMWEASTRDQIDRLQARRSRLCPEYDAMVERVATEEFWRDTYALTIAGARTALRYFTFGMY